jgi:hypothetical protein
LSQIATGGTEVIKYAWKKLFKNWLLLQRKSASVSKTYKRKHREAYIKMKETSVFVFSLFINSSEVWVTSSLSQCFQTLLPPE